MYKASTVVFCNSTSPVELAQRNSHSQENFNSAIEVAVVGHSELSEAEHINRLNLERQVQRAFYEAGKALIELSLRKLYRSTHKTFESYCKDIFGFERRHPYRLIEATRVVDNLIEMCPIWTQNQIEDVNQAIDPDYKQILPTNESQVRPLVSLEPEVQRTVWELSVQEAGGKVPSGRLVKKIVDNIQQQTNLPNSYKIGEVCQIAASCDPKLKGKAGCWGIITQIAEYNCTIMIWDGEYQVKIENLKSLEYSNAESEYMQQFCQRLRRLHLVDNLDPSVNDLLSGFGKRLQPHLTPVQEKLLAVAEQEYLG